MKRIEILMCFLALLFSQAYLRAEIISGYGTYSSASTSINQGDFRFDTAGGEFEAVAEALQNTYGNAQAYADTAGSTYLPNLKVLASSPGSLFSASARAFAVQGFTFDAQSAARTIQLNVDLHGSISNNPIGNSNNSLSASIAVIRSSQLPWYPSFGTLVFEGTSPEERLAVGDAFLNSPGLDQTKSTTLSFDINPGDDFFVVAQLDAFSRNGLADGFHTLTLSFNNPAGLSASLTAVPEPSSLVLGLGAVVFAACRRKRSNR